MLHSKTISIFGKLMVLEGGILLVPLLILPFYRNEAGHFWQFAAPGLLSILLGITVGKRRIRKQSSSRIVVFAWFYGFVLAAVPFYLLGTVSPVQAVFESVSGFTTTGLSVLDVERLPHIFLFYRGFLQYVGGLGFVMMMILFIQEKDSVRLYQAEGHPDKLMPNIGKTAKTICFMYGFFLLIGTMLYILAGMSVLDSLVHSMCALSTGGFSNRLDSIGAYQSLPIEWITIALMMIGTTNFSLLLLLFQGRIRAFFRASEIRFLAVLTMISVPVMTIFLAEEGGLSGNYIQQSLFNAFSALSTTGYSTSSYRDWPETALAVMILLMIIGGGIGSTAGGIKLGRVCRLMKDLTRNVKKKMIPDRTVTLSYYWKGAEKERLDGAAVQEASVYAQTYLLIYMAGTLALTHFSGCTLLEGAFEFASSLGTVGLSIGVTNADTSAICLLIEIAGMILGRLEIFVLFQAFSRKLQV